MEQCIRSRIGLLVVLILALAPAKRLVAKDTTTTDPTSRIDEYLGEIFSPGDPGAAILVAVHGKTIYLRGFGMADVELGVPIQPDMIFRLGSITKQFTGAAIMMLVEEGKIALEDEIGKLVPGYPAQGHKITLEHLLVHTSGIRSYTGMPEWRDLMRKDFTTEGLIDLFKDEPMDFGPGERFRYNNSAYFLLGAIIEKTSGMTYADFIQTRIFEPLGMKSSHYGDHIRLIPKRVSGYEKTATGFENCDFLSMTQPFAAGSLLSSVDDLLRWDNAITAGDLLTAESWKRIFTANKLNDGTETGYGYGFFVSQLRGSLSLEHGGGIHGFRTHAMRLPNEEIYTAVLTNSGGRATSPSDISHWIGALLLGKPFVTHEKISLAEEELEQYVGVYEIDGGGQRSVTRQENRLFTQRVGSRQLEAFAFARDRFFYENSLADFQFDRDESGKNVIGMTMHNPQQDEIARKTVETVAEAASPELTDKEIDSLVGKYELAPGFEIEVSRQGGRIMAQATGQQAFQIFPTTPTHFFVKVVDAQIDFVLSGTGAATQLILTQGGRKTPGKRID